MAFEEKNLEYRLIKNDLERHLFVSAWEEAFDRKFDPQVASWIFNERNNMYAIFDGDKIIAGYCLLNNKVVYNQNIVAGALCNNVFVSPDYRGLNLFVKLSHYALQEAAEQGIKIALGIPNESAAPGHRRVGWTSFDQIDFLEKNIIVASKAISNNNIKVLNAENYAIYQEQLEAFSYKIASQRTFSVLKDKSYFKWRYIERPSVNYKIFIFVENDIVSGYVVYKAYEALKRLHIIDIEAENAEIFNELIKLIDCIEEAFNLVNVWDSSIYSEYFIQAGFSRSIEYNNLIAIRPQINEPVLLGDKVNIVLADNEVF